MRLCRNRGHGGVATACLAFALTLADPARAAAKKTTEVVTSTLLIPSVSTADGDHIHASVVSVDAEASATTLKLRCVDDSGESGCASGVFDDQTLVYGPATVSVELDGRAWGCEAVAATSASPTCSEGSASPTTITDGSWSTAVTITSGVEKMRKTRVVVFTRDGSTVTSTTTEQPGVTGSPTTGATPTQQADDDGALCKRKINGQNTNAGDGDGVDGASPTRDSDDETGDSRAGGSGGPCSRATRSGLDTIVVGTATVILALGFAVSRL